MPLLIDLILLVVLVVGSPIWLRKQRAGWRERLGGIERLPDPVQGRRRVLLHAVSVGEVNLCAPLIGELLAGGGVDVVLSVGTDTGIARARSMHGGLIAEGGLVVVRYPLDVSFAVRRFLRAVRPDAVALVELELWPNFLTACAKRSVPVVVVNGRLSERSFRNYRAARWVVGRYFRMLQGAGVQSEAYAARFRAMGARGVRVLGTMKWDAAARPEDLPGLVERGREIAGAMGIDLERPLVVAGSTGPGEPGLLRGAVPAGVQLLVAPRKPEWYAGAAAELPGAVRRTEGVARRGEFFVLDTIGELRALYAVADVVVVGRSFGDLHGSDVMEPASLGKAVLIGPAHGDFVETVEILSDAGALRVTTADRLADDLGEILGDAGVASRMGAAGLACVAARRGAAVAYAGFVRGALGGAGG